MRILKRKKSTVIALVVLMVFGVVYGNGSRKGGSGEFNKLEINSLEKEKYIASETDVNEEQGALSDSRYGQKKLVSKLKDKGYYESLNNKKLSWWIKRNNEHDKSQCEDSVNLSEYNAYYVDNRRYGKDRKKMDDKVLYLTFDCGYDNGLTEGMLDVLKKYDVPACFFVTRTFIRDNVMLVKRMKAEGHQVGNHTSTHPSMPDKSYDELVDDISKCAEYMKEATGYDMDPYFRPPSGEYSERTLRLTQDMGYKSIFWSIVYLDYDVNKQPGKEYVINHFEKYHHDGAIILMHNVSTSNAQALETVIRNMQAAGYRFASLNELE